MKVISFFKKYPKTSGFVVGAAALTLVAANERANHGKYFEISKNIEIFTNLYKELNTYYVDDLDPSKLMRTGVDAMLNSLDPYTNYISESDIEGYRYITEGKYNGVGASFDKTDDYVFVTDIFDASPSQKAGLKAGDKIVAVDGKSAKGKSIDEVGDILRGAPGTDVELTVARPQLDGSDKTMKIKVIRDEVTEKNVPYYGMLNDKVGYIVLTTFTRDAGENVEKAFKELKEKNPNMKGLVFDLRGNGGGLLNEAVNICNIWIPKGEMVVTTKGKVVDWDRSFKTLNPSVDEQMPIVVLVDKGTASASEIVSGTLQDYDRAVVMGQRSYGKGLVQNVRDIGYNSKLKLTTAKYYIPSGRCIQAVKYDKGTPVELPDSARAKFKTRSGREVLDGGGIKPDILLDKDSDVSLMKTLKDKFLIFDYVTMFSLKNPTIAEPDKFRFADFDDFVNFLSKRNFQYDSESEKLVKKLKAESKKEKYATIDAELQAIEAKIMADKKNDLQKHKAEIINEIEKEIVSRYYFENGLIKIGLRNDIEIQESIKLLSDLNRYKSVLKK
ncbi:MAG: S41 family peptidase [Saprospiraceae bacterium]|nr:S41 family peptidase [Saprospiraceae bacterium]